MLGSLSAALGERKSDATQRPRLITRRLVLGLSCWVSLHALLIAVAVLGPIPGLNVLHGLAPPVLPYALVGLSVTLALVFAPLWIDVADLMDLKLKSLRMELLVRAAFVGVWQGAACGYFLLVASRVEAVASGALVRCVLIVAATSILAALLAATRPRAYGGFVGLWAVGLPFLCYLLVEVLLTTPGGASGWTGPSGHPAVQSTVNWILSLTPGTAAVAALNGKLVSGAPFAWTNTAAFLAMASCLGGLSVWRSAPPANQR